LLAVRVAVPEYSSSAWPKANAVFLGFDACKAPPMNLSWLEDFLAVAATGNFSRAADKRHMTQPAFSRRIRALEEWLGTDLFDRSEQPVRLTEAGQWFRKVAQDLLAQVARIPGEARAVTEAHATTLRFAATHVLSFSFMPEWLRGLEPHADLGPILLLSDVQQKCEALLLQGEVQFVLSHAHPRVRGPLEEGGYPSVLVGSDRLIPVSAADERGTPLHRLSRDKQAAPVPVLNYSAESGLNRILKSLLGPTLAQQPTQAVFTAHLASVLRTVALGRRGLAWLPAVLIADDLAAGRLVVAAADDWHITLEVRLYRDKAAMGAAAEKFWSAVDTHRQA
jgi:DNA-binding transcriptional LysR family regulator